MKNYKITTTYPCLIVLQDKHIFLEEGQSLKIDQASILSIYPSENSKVDIPFNLNLKEEHDTNRFCYVEKESEGNYFLTSSLSCENYVISSLSIGDNTCKFEIGENKVIIKFLQYKKIIALTNRFDKYKTGVLSNCCYCLLSSSRQEQLILFNTKTGKVDVLNADQIKINSNNIQTTCNYDNIARHIVDKEYIVTPEGLAQKSQSISYQNGRAIVSSSAQTVPYAFLEAIQIGDIELAYSYLDIQMKRQVDQEHLKAYFGEIKSFYAINTNSFIVYSDKEKKIFDFVLNENKILEIEQQ